MARHVEVDVRRSPATVADRIGARLDRPELEIAATVGAEDGVSLKVRIDRDRAVHVAGVAVAAARIGLPNFDPRVRYGIAFHVEDAANDVDCRSFRGAAQPLYTREIGVRV